MFGLCYIFFYLESLSDVFRESVRGVVIDFNSDLALRFDCFKYSFRNVCVLNYKSEQLNVDFSNNHLSVSLVVITIIMIIVIIII